MGTPSISNIGAFIKPVICGAARGVAAGTGDNTAVTGATIDRKNYGSCSLVIAARAVLADTKLLKIAAAYQESADGSNWDTAVALQASTTLLTGSTGGTTELGVAKFDVNLMGLKRYIRFNYTPDLDASGTDTFETTAVAILGGASVLPTV